MIAVFEGFWAGFEGGDPRTNPYPKLSREWRDWAKWHALVVDAVWSA